MPMDLPEAKFNFHSRTNSFHSAMPGALRMSADVGFSFGARGAGGEVGRLPEQHSMSQAEERAAEAEMFAHPAACFRLAFSTIFAHIGIEAFKVWRKL